MIIGKVIDDSDGTGYVKSLAQLTEQEYVTKMQFAESNIEQSCDKMLLKLFHHHCHKEKEEIEKFLNSEGLSKDRIKLFFKQFELWKKNEPSLRNVEISERENLLDLQWRLMVKSGGSIPTPEATFVQLVLLVEKNGTLKKHHLEMGVPKFYDFLHKLSNGNDGVQELLKG